MQAELVEEFGVDETAWKIAAQMKKGIYPVGFLPIDSLSPIIQNACLPEMMED